MGPQEDLFYIVIVFNKKHMAIKGLWGCPMASKNRTGLIDCVHNLTCEGATLIKFQESPSIANYYKLNIGMILGGTCN